MTFQLNKQAHETFALFITDNMHDEPYELERSDDWQYLYDKKWAYDEESDNFEVYEVRIVQKINLANLVAALLTIQF